MVALLARKCPAAMVDTLSSPPETTSSLAQENVPSSVPLSSAHLSLVGPSGFVSGLQYEWNKISWPTPLQLVAQTVVVVLMTSAMTLLIWGLDWFWRMLIQWIVPARGL
jgi:preprotein translocase SecE subunit